MFSLGRSAYWNSPVLGILKAGSFTRHRCLATHSVSLLDELASRDLIAGVTRPEKFKDALVTPQSIYLGIDPTAGSLHVGHLLPLVCLLHFQMRGHTIIPLIGGATGLVGDPSGRTTERKPTDDQTIDENVTGLKASVEKFFDRAIGYVEKRVPQCRGTLLQPRILNNLDWLSNINLLDFLRTVGVSARVNTMLNRDSVQLRMESKPGISFTEFTYQLLQAYDFYKLHTLHRCKIQLGGSDQWGNIMAGLDLIRRLGDATPGYNNDHEETAFGITIPLLTTASGEKFGKSAGNAVWLNDRLTSVFDFYQFFLRTTDLNVERYLKMFTLLPVTTIHDVMQSHLLSPEKRMAQRLLADELTELVHTEHGLHRAQIVTKLLFDCDYSQLKAEDVISALEDDPRLVYVDKKQLFAFPLTRLATTYALTPSYAAARKLAKAGGFYMNNSPIRDPFFEASRTDLLDDRMIVLRAGRDQHLILMSR